MFKTFKLSRDAAPVVKVRLWFEFCPKSSPSLSQGKQKSSQLKIDKVLTDMKIFLIIKLMLTYVNANVNVNVHDNCLISYTSSPVYRLTYFYPRIR